MHDSCKVSTNKNFSFGFNDHTTLVSDVPKKDEAVILLSTIHHNISIDKEEA